jgi:hypothetical protein
MTKSTSGRTSATTHPHADDKKQFRTNGSSPSCGPGSPSGPTTRRSAIAHDDRVQLGGAVWSVEITIDNPDADAAAARALLRRLRLQRTFTGSSATAMAGRVLLRAEVPAATAGLARQLSTDTLELVLGAGWIVLEMQAHRACH